MQVLCDCKNTVHYIIVVDKKMHDWHKHNHEKFTHMKHVSSSIKAPSVFAMLLKMWGEVGSEVLLLMLMLLPDVTLELRNEKWFLSFNSVMGLLTYRNSITPLGQLLPSWLYTRPKGVHVVRLLAFVLNDKINVFTVNLFRGYLSSLDRYIYYFNYVCSLAFQ